MDNFLSKAPELIREAAKSTLGILALVVFILSTLALAFFTTASETVKVGIFVLVFLGASLFVMSVLRLAKLEQTQNLILQSTNTKPNTTEPLDQVAAICYRPKGASIELLLVKTDGGRWTFPKVKINAEEEPWRAVQRGAFEESGVSGEISHEPLTTYLHFKQGMKQSGIELRVSAYPLMVKTIQATKEKGRKPRWFSPKEAEKALSRDRHFKYAEELKRVIRKAVTILL